MHHMVEFFQGRRLRYEIQALIAERWQVVGVIDDQREALGREFDRHDFEALENRVHGTARTVLEQPGVGAVRVVRERQRDDGFASQEEIFNERSSPQAKVERGFNDYHGELPPCGESEDLLRRPARRVIGIVLRPLLDSIDATPLELLTVEGASRTVARADNAIAGAIARIAQLQAKDGGTTRERIDTLDEMAAKLRRLIKEAEATRRPVIPEAASLETFMDDVEATTAPADRMFRVCRGLAMALRKAAGPSAKFDLLLDMLAAVRSPEAIALLDGALADVLDNPIAIQELLGMQRDLKRALQSLAALATGRAVAGVATAPGRTTPLQRLAAAIAGGRTPELVGAVWDRVIRSLDGAAALTHDNAAGEWQALEELDKTLPPLAPAPQRAAIARAIAKRRSRLQEGLLETE